MPCNKLRCWYLFVTLLINWQRYIVWNVNMFASFFLKFFFDGVLLKLVSHLKKISVKLIFVQTAHLREPNGDQPCRLHMYWESFFFKLQIPACFIRTDEYIFNFQNLVLRVILSCFLAEILICVDKCLHFLYLAIYVDEI